MADNDDRFNRGTEPTTRETEHMHRLHDERMHPLHEEKKKGPNWLWLLVPLILGLLVLPNLFRGHEKSATNTTTTTREQVATTNRDNAVTYLGQRWVVSGNAQALPSSQMRRVATTANGQVLYADTTQGGGGGGENLSNEDVVRSTDRLYMRAADGRFVPLSRD